MQMTWTDPQAAIRAAQWEIADRKARGDALGVWLSEMRLADLEGRTISREAWSYMNETN